MIDIIYSPYLKEYKNPTGAIQSFEECYLKILINKNFNIKDLKLIVYDDYNIVCNKLLTLNNQNNDYNEYKVSFNIDKPYLYWYYFEFVDEYGKHYIGSDEYLNAKLFDKDVNSFQLNVYDKTYSNFNWFQGKVMYQILVDRFYKGGSNPQKSEGYFYKDWLEPVRYEPINGKYSMDYYGGDLLGIIAKLPYLQKLNVKVLYLNPIFKAPSHHKYNTSDYSMIDEMFGTEEDFKKLIEECKKLSINIILDGVFNHTGDDSLYFNKYNTFKTIGAYQNIDSKYHYWYKFKKFPDEYDSWWGIKSLPAVNQHSGFVDFITSPKGIIAKWMRFGIKGFRLDVVDEINPQFLRMINSRIKAIDNNAITLGEVWEDASNKISYGSRRTYFNGKELDSVMNYPIKDAIIDYLNNGKIEHFVIKARQLVNNYPKHVLNSLMNILSTHDTVRAISVFSKVSFSSLSNKEISEFQMTKLEYYNARSILKMAYAILYTFPGIPSIYYGDELGLQGYKDPFCRKSMPWDNGDYELADYFIHLGKLRDEEIFIDGDFEINSWDNQVLIYSRFKDNIDEVIITIINNSNYEYCYHVPYAKDLMNDFEIFDYVVIESKNAMIIKTKKR